MIMAEANAARAAERILRPSEEELLDAWRQIHAANAEQVARIRESEHDDDAISPEGSATPPGYEAFMLERSRNPGPEIRILDRFARPDDWWIDIGAGVGPHALYLSTIVEWVVAIDPSPGQLAGLRRNIAAAGVDNVEPDQRSWPPERKIGEADVCFCDNVTYFVPDIGPFLDGMEEHARRLCVIGTTELGTGFQPLDPIFEELYGETYIRLPGLRELLAILSARRRRFDVHSIADMRVVVPVAGHTIDGETLDDAHARVRNHYFVRAGSEKDQRLKELVAEHYSIGEGRVRLPLPAGNFRAVVSWAPPAAVE